MAAGAVVAGGMSPLDNEERYVISVAIKPGHTTAHQKWRHRAAETIQTAFQTAGVTHLYSPESTVEALKLILMAAHAFFLQAAFFRVQSPSIIHGANWLELHPHDIIIAIDMM